MPLTGSAPLLASSIKQMVIQQNAAHGLAPADPKALDALSTGIAQAVIAHLLANLQIAPGIPVATPTGAGSTIAPGTAL